MSHRSTPPSVTSGRPVKAVLLRLLKASNALKSPGDSAPTARTDLNGQPVERIVRGGRVRFFPSPGGVVRIVGVAESGEWLAEFACREEDFTDAFLRRMERHVAAKAGARLAVI